MWIFDLIGSLGLFLLGMWLMTEGLKLAGGRVLQSLLGHWTSSRVRGLFAGVLVTALVQSSSAVTVAAIGFVNAGLMTFQQSVWVIFGSNVGTTMTAWLVTLFGFNVEIDSYTFPLCGVGAFLRVFATAKRVQALGMALAGFGLLFMGIESLQSTFAGLQSSFDISSWNLSGARQIFIGVALGLVLTLLTQSSSAAIALILTAVASGVADLSLAAAAVIGANVGTTSTAILASIGATINARRLALAHVAFNVITAVFALLLMPLFMTLASAMVNTGSGGGMTLVLALFHSFFNILGVAIMWFLEPTLTRWLLRKYERPSEENKATNLDKNVAAIPDLALRALSLELKELRDRLTSIELDQLLQPLVSAPDFAATGSADQNMPELRKRLDGVNQFIGLISQSDLSAKLSEQVTAGFTANHYLDNAFETLEAIAGQVGKSQTISSMTAGLLRDWLIKVGEFARDIGHTDETFHATHWAELLSAYAIFKNQVLSAGVHRQADINSVELTLFIASLSKRFIDQLLQASTALGKLTSSGQDSEIKVPAVETPAVGQAVSPAAAEEDGRPDAS